MTKTLIHWRNSTLLASCVVLVSPIFCDAQGTWKQRANFPGMARYGSVGFAVADKGYIGTGYSGSSDFGDFWQYDPGSNTWSQKASMSSPRRAASAFTIGSKAYVCLGLTNSASLFKDLYEYDPSTNIWTRKSDLPASARYGAAGFSMDGKGYIACGNMGTSSGPYTNEFWQYDPVADSWTSMPNYPGVARYGMTHMGWSIGKKAYVGFGYSGTFWNDLYEYDLMANSWTKKANFPGTGRSYGVAFAVCGRYFAGTGQSNGTAYRDIWEYNPASDTWTQAADFGGGNRWIMSGFVLRDTAYFGTGYDFTSYYKDWWQYTCEARNVPLLIISSVTDASCSNLCTGSVSVNASGGAPPFMYQWDDPTSQTGATATGLCPGSYRVCVTDSAGSTICADTIVSAPQALIIFLGPDTGSCDKVTMTIGGAPSGGTPGYMYLWNDANSSTTQNITVTSSVTTTYVVTVNDTNGCTASDDIVIMSSASPVPGFGYTSTPNCDGLEVTFFNNSTGGTSYFWHFGDGSTSSEPNPTHHFRYNTVNHNLLIVSNNGCSDSINVTDTVFDFNHYQDIHIPNIFTPNGDGFNDVFVITVSGNLVECVFLEKIINRWGRKVYEPASGKLSWDGRTTEGKEVPEGTYYYVVKLRDRAYAGWVQLIRNTK